MWILNHVSCKTYCSISRFYRYLPTTSTTSVRPKFVLSYFIKHIILIDLLLSFSATASIDSEVGSKEPQFPYWKPGNIERGRDAVNPICIDINLFLLCKMWCSWVRAGQLNPKLGSACLDRFMIPRMHLHSEEHPV